jgi:hypothetical protein
MELDELRKFADKVGCGYKGLGAEALREKLRFEAA